MADATVSAAKQFDNGWFVEKTIIKKGKAFKQWFKVKDPTALKQKLAASAAGASPATLAAAAPAKGAGARLMKAKRAQNEANAQTDAERLMAKKVGPQAGSNPGGLYEGADGKKRYVKHYDNPTQALQEQLASKIYRDLGHDVPTTTLFEHGGKKSIASDIVEGKTIGQAVKELGEPGHVKAKAREFLKGFMGDVLTGNWDAAGLSSDNALVTPGGQVLRIDTGGALLRRASGAAKPAHLVNQISEWEGFFDHKVNPSYAAIASMAGVKKAEDLGDQLHEGMKQILKLEKRYGGWGGYLQKTVPELVAKHPAEAVAISNMLKARTALLKERVDKIPPGDPGPGWKYVQKEILRKGKTYKQWFRVKDRDVAGLTKAKKLKALVKPPTFEEAGAFCETQKTKLFTPGDQRTQTRLDPAVHERLVNEATHKFKQIEGTQMEDALRSFTGGGYQALRAVQAGLTAEQAKKFWVDADEFERAKKQAPILAHAQEHMAIHEPTQHGPLYRGINVSRETLHALLTGESVTHNGYDTNSSSYSRAIAEGFLSGQYKGVGLKPDGTSSSGTPWKPHKEYPVVFVYKKVKKGYNFMHSQNFSNQEQEIALPRGEYKIVGRKYVEMGWPGGGSHFEIEVEQVD